jgi:CHAD domain-containing protein
VPMAVGPSLAQALESRWLSYREQLRHCQEECSEEAVHELRVATRRLLAQFTLLSCVVPSTALEKTRRVLKRHLDALGDLRDTHVQSLFLDQQAARYPELVLLRSWLKRRERRLVKTAAERVSRFKNRKLERWITAMIGDLMTNAGGARAQSRLATTVLQATAGAFAEAAARRRAIDVAVPRTIHQTRVAFKRFRYMMESLSPGLTGLSKRELRALAYYQRKMGIIQDLEVIQACVAAYLREKGERADLLRPFCRHLRQRRARALRSFVKTADRLFGFWPPPALASRGDRISTLHAA